MSSRNGRLILFFKVYVMIRVFKDWKILEEYKWCISSLKDVEVVFKTLQRKYKVKNVDIPAYCEEPMQHTLREHGFELQGL